MPRIGELDMTIPALIIMNENSNGITTTNLIAELRSRLRPSGEDLDILDNRNDDKFSQKVRNMVSHKEGGNNIISKGLAEYIPGEPSGMLKITTAGKELLP